VGTIAVAEVVAAAAIARILDLIFSAKAGMGWRIDSVLAASLCS